MSANSDHVLFMISDDNYLDIARANAKALTQLWGCDVHIFLENGAQPVHDLEGEDGIYIRRNLLSSYIPKDAPIRDLWPIIIYGRLFAPHFLTNYSRAIYIDVDVFPVYADQSIFDIPLPGGIAATQDGEFIGISSDTVQGNTDHWPASVGLTSHRYFNSGVILLDIAAWNAKDIRNRLDEFIQKYAGGTQMPDQDFLNWEFEDQWTELSPRFNYQKPLFNYGYEVVFEPMFIHFTGKEKPWKAVYGPLTVQGQFLALYKDIFHTAGLDIEKYRQVPVKPSIETKLRRVRMALGQTAKREIRLRVSWQARVEKLHAYFLVKLKNGEFADISILDIVKPEPHIYFDGDFLTRRLCLPQIGMI